MGAPPGGAPPGRTPIPEAEILTRLPQISFLTRAVPPPASVYITPDDRLEIISRCSVAGVGVTIWSRILLGNGEVVANVSQHTPNSDRSQAADFFNMPEGFLLGLAVSANNVGARRGQCFVQVRINRGLVGATLPMNLLISGYASVGDVLGWPGGLLQSQLEGPGMLRSITGTDPAAGAEISETVPTNARWHVLAVRGVLVTDATAANRDAVLVLDDGTTEYARLPNSVPVTASLTGGHSWIPGGILGDIGATVQIIPLPQPLLLFQGHRIRTATSSLQAADDWGAPQLLVEEWIEE